MCCCAQTSVIKIIKPLDDLEILKVYHKTVDKTMNLFVCLTNLTVTELGFFGYGRQNLYPKSALQLNGAYHLCDCNLALSG